MVTTNGWAFFGGFGIDVVSRLHESLHDLGNLQTSGGS